MATPPKSDMETNLLVETVEEAVANIAEDLYGARVKFDLGVGHEPESRVMYMKGVYDVLTCIEVWSKEMEPSRFTEVLESLLNQSEAAVRAG